MSISWKIKEKLCLDPVTETDLETEDSEAFI